MVLFSLQSDQIEEQKGLVAARSVPKVNLFGQGGYGRPGLNLLKNEFDPFFITGVRFNWNLGSLYTAANEKKLLDLNKNTLLLQQETFLLNTNAQLAQSLALIRKLEQLVASDEQIILLRERVKKAAQAQLENGVITVNDYLKEVNAEDAAKQLTLYHKTQLLQAKLNHQTITGY